MTHDKFSPSLALASSYRIIARFNFRAAWLVILVLIPGVALSQNHPSGARPGDKAPEVRLIVMRTRGFEPSEITVPAGKVLLVVHNRSGLANVKLRLDRVGGDRLHEVDVHREKLDWKDWVELKPGHYVLTEASHSMFHCSITVQ